MLQTIGTMFSNLAEFPEAEKPLKTVAPTCASRRRAHTSAEAAAALSALSEMYSQSKKFEEAERGTPARRSRLRAGFTAPRASRRRLTLQPLANVYTGSGKTK